MFLSSEKAPLFVVGGVFSLYVVGRVFGADIFENHWSFIHWKQISGWYPWVWAAITAALYYCLANYASPASQWLNSRRRIGLVLGALLVGFVAFHTDSFLFGAGNLRVAQVSQGGSVILRWYELGGVSFASIVTWLLSLLGVTPGTAGVVSWRFLSYLATAFSILGVAKLSGELSADRRRQILLFVIGLFGPQTIVYFGFVGIEPVVVPITIWAAWLSVRISRQPRLRYLASLWLLTGFGVFLHLSLAFLIPATVYMSVAMLVRHRKWQFIPFVAGLLAIATLLHFTYQEGARSLEFSQHILFLSGKLPFRDYALFSKRHLEDLLGLFFLIAPMALAAKLVAIIRRDWLKLDKANLSIWFMALTGTMVVLIVDPANSIVMDLPRLAAYLTPYSLLLMLMLGRPEENQVSNRLLTLTATVSVAVALTYLPSYRFINSAERLVTSYADEHKAFWRTTAIALRDAYFGIGNIDKANEWDQDLVIRSTDYLTLRSCSDLIAHQGYADALQVLYRLVATNPYWAEPRAMLAATQLRLGRNELAKPHIDTCLMLEPYTVQHHLNLYAYYRNTEQLPQALVTIQTARHSHPEDLQLIASLMAARYLNRELDRADSLAQYLFEADTMLAGPYLFKAMIEDERGNLEEAANYYRQFVEMAPFDPDQPTAQKRLNEIVLELRKK